MKLSIVVAMDENGLIGANQRLPWYLPADLEHFKALTMGHAILMGRRTHESIGRALPGRQNIVLTRRPDYRADGCTVVNDLKHACEAAGGQE
ncbi:MAG: dihydrofolate reductase, partial [Vicinamibacterales bacterium]